MEVARITFLNHESIRYRQLYSDVQDRENVYDQRERNLRGICPWPSLLFCCLCELSCSTPLPPTPPPLLLPSPAQVTHGGFGGGGEGEGEGDGGGGGGDGGDGGGAPPALGDVLPLRN